MDLTSKMRLSSNNLLIGELMKGGIDVNKVDTNGQTACDLAANLGDEAIFYQIKGSLSKTLLNHAKLGTCEVIREVENPMQTQNSGKHSAIISGQRAGNNGKER